VPSREAGLILINAVLVEVWDATAVAPVDPGRQSFCAREPIMTRQTIMSLIVASIVGAASVAITSDEAFAFRGGRGGGARHMGGHHGRVHHHHVYRAPVRRGVAVGAAAAGAAGAYYYGQPKCGYQPYPPCY
jgi:hypothetical protein